VTGQDGPARRRNLRQVSHRQAPPRPATARRNVAAAAAGIGLVAVAVAVGAVLRHRGVALYAGAAPLFGRWEPHLGPGTPVAVAVALAVVARGPDLAARLPWPRLLAAGYATAVAWTLSLAMVDGWDAGIAGRLTGPDEYLHEVPGVTDIGATIAGFAGRILDHRPDSWTTHVAGHPPGALLVFVGFDRVGLGGGGAAAMACVLVGATVAVSVPVALRALGTPGALGAEASARAAVPFVALFPGAVWMGASADALFAGVTAGGIALLAVGAARGRDLPALAGGVLLGCGLYLSYGLTLMALPALAVGLVVRRVRPLLVAAAGVALVVAAFSAAGFWWLDGYHLVVERYYQGIASERPYGYWVWANLACLVLAAGPSAVAGLAAARRQPLLVLAVAAAVVLADLSGLSKAETERIWLPFAVWLAAAGAVLPNPRRWLATGAIVALLVNHLVLTGW
jgi:methylthioxylose transferase